jgi:hypothetical protein
MLDLVYSFIEKYHLIDLFKNIFYFGITGVIIAILVNPLQFLKIIRQQTGKKYKEIIADNYQKYGIKVFYRSLIPYMMLNFLVNAAFGISEFFMNLLLSPYNLQLTILGIIIRIISASFFETLLTARSEVKAIAKNKGNLMIEDGKVSAILPAIIARNAVNWMGALFSVYFIHLFELNYLHGFILSFFVGIIFAIATLPFDIVATHNCGDIEKLSILERLKKISFEAGGYHGAYRGSLMRIIMMTCYSVGIVIVERYLMG